MRTSSAVRTAAPAGCLWSLLASSLLRLLQPSAATVWPSGDAPPLDPPRLELTLAAGLGAELLEYGAIADQKNDKGKTPLDKAIEHELDYRPKHSGARHSSHIVQLLEDALGGKREDL